MSVPSEPAVRIEAIAAATDLSLNSVARALRQGRIPKADTFIRRSSNGGPACAWKLSTLRAWNPAIAERCARLLQDPEPPKAAALTT